MGNNLYLLLDAARMGANIITAKKLNLEFDSMYRGRNEEHLSNVSPYLFTFKHNIQFDDWYLQNGWGNSWGVLVFADIDMKALVKHFRHFLMVKKEDGEKLYFRFYDPRVLRIFLPTCDSRQLNDFFGPVDYFISEDEDPETGLIFFVRDGELKTDKISKNQVSNFQPYTPRKKFSWF